METLSRECCSWELLYADYLVIMSDNLEDSKIQLHAWKTSLHTLDLRIYKGKTKILGSSGDAQKHQEMLNGFVVLVPKVLVSTQYFSRVAASGFIKDARELQGTVKKERMFRCKKCKGEIVPTDSLNSIQVHVGEDTFEAVSTFQYLGDVLGELGGCVDVTSTCINLLRNWGNFFTSCITKSLPYGCET